MIPYNLIRWKRKQSKNQITIIAEQLAKEITNFNIKKNDLHGESKITSEHIKNIRIFVHC